MRTAFNNPFSPGSDTVPEIWAGRSTQLNDWADIVRPRRTAGLPERGRTILGEAGLGKSALVRRIAASAEQSGDWVTPQLRIPVGTDALKAVATTVLRLANKAGLPASREKHIRDALDRVRTVAASGISLTLDRANGPEPYTALSELLIEVGKAADKAGRAVLIHIDEVQNITAENQLSQLLISLGDAITYEHTINAPGGVELTKALPIAVYLTGLPDFAELAGARRGATFARRFATTTLTPISDDDFTLALHPFVAEGWQIPDDAGEFSLVHMTQEASAKIVELAKGEPFLFQLAGERAWYSDNTNMITLENVIDGWSGIVSEASLHIERILDRLPARERQFVEVMASLSPADRTLTTTAKRWD